MEQSHTETKTPLFTRKVVLFLLSQNLSLFGSSVVGYSIIWYITLQTSSGFYLMLATLAQMVPHLLISLYSGVWADRYSRKSLIMISDSFIAVATFVLAILFSLGWESLTALLVVSVIRSFGQGVQSPAVSAIIPQLVEEEHLVRIQAINQSINSVLLLLSPAVGGLMLGLFGIETTFFLDVVTACLAVVVFSFIKVAKPIRSNQNQSMFEDIKIGIRYTLSNRLLRNLLVCYGFSFFLITPAAILTPLMVERTFGDEVWRLTLNEMVWTGGALLGGLLVSLKGKINNKVRAISLSLLGFGVFFGLLGIAPNFIIYLVFMAIAGLFMPVLNTAEAVLIQETCEEDKLGRVFSMVQILAGSAMPLGILLFGPLSDRVSVELLLIVSGILLAVVGLLYGRTALPQQPVKEPEVSAPSA